MHSRSRVWSTLAAAGFAALTIGALAFPSIALGQMATPQVSPNVTTSSTADLTDKSQKITFDQLQQTKLRIPVLASRDGKVLAYVAVAGQDVAGNKVFAKSYWDASGGEASISEVEKRFDNGQLRRDVVYYNRTDNKWASIGPPSALTFAPEPAADSGLLDRVFAFIGLGGWDLTGWLKPRMVDVEFSSTPDGAQIWADGLDTAARTEFPGKAPVDGLTAFTLKKAGFRDCGPQQQTITHMSSGAVRISCHLLPE